MPNSAIRRWNVYIMLLGIVLGMAAGNTGSSRKYYLNTESERRCACTHSKIWLDIAIVVDVSASMTATGLAQISTLLTTAFQEMTIAQGEKHASRVALITFGKTSTLIGNLSSFADNAAFGNALNSLELSGDNDVNLLDALRLTQLTFLSNGQTNRRQVVVIITSAYSAVGPYAAKQIVTQLKESSVTVVTIAVVQENEGEIAKTVGQLASHRMNFTFDQSVGAHQMVTNGIHNAFCSANCFCRNNWIQYTAMTDAGTMLYGECMRYADLDASWMAARMACQVMTNGAGSLVTELTEGKHRFVAELVRQSPTRPEGELEFFNGLHFDEGLGIYAWQTPRHKKLGTSAYANWDVGFPDLARGSCIKVAANSSKTVWRNEKCEEKALRYVCQIDACDTDTYCETVS